MLLGYWEGRRKESFLPLGFGNPGVRIGSFPTGSWVDLVPTGNGL